MKIFLSSYRAGDYSAELLELIGGIKKIAVVTNAKDYKSAAERATSVSDNFSYWRSLGLEPTEIDLRPYFHKTGANKLLETFNFIWLAGGNTFLLRRALKYSGIDNFLIKNVREGKTVYGGESAGAIMAGPSLHGSEDDSTNEDDPHFIPKGYDKEVLWDGLGFLDYVLVPHFESPDIGDSIDGYVKYLENKNIPFKTIREEQALIIDGDRTEILE